MEELVRIIHFTNHYTFLADQVLLEPCKVGEVFSEK